MSDKKHTSTVMPTSEDHNTAIMPQRQAELILDQEGQRPVRTRGELYKELTKNDKAIEDEDYFELSNPIYRGISLVIDAAFTFGVIKLAMTLPSLEVKLIQTLFLDKYNLQFMFGDKAFVKLMLVLTIFFALFFVIVIPIAFFNVSLGKKLTKQRVRGDHKYTLSITQAFQRELIFKPISIVCLVGFILPFFDKKKKSLHDKMAGTFVIKE